MLNKEQLAILKDELIDDPKNLGYTSDDSDCAALLNTAGASSEIIDVEVIDGQLVSAAVVIAEYKALTAEERDAWTTILVAGNGQIDVSNTDIRTQIGAIWGAGTSTRAALVALQTRDASRAEIRFGAGISVAYMDVGRARLSGEGY